MEIKYDVPDQSIAYFSENAKIRLIEQSKEYTTELIKEADRIEASQRERGAAPDINETFVFIAADRYKKKPKKNYILIITQIISELFLFISGIMFMPEVFVTDGKLNIGYFILFLIITLGAFGTLIATHLSGGD